MSGLPLHSLHQCRFLISDILNFLPGMSSCHVFASLIPFCLFWPKDKSYITVYESGTQRFMERLDKCVNE